MSCGEQLEGNPISYCLSFWVLGSNGGSRGLQLSLALVPLRHPHEVPLAYPRYYNIALSISCQHFRKSGFGDYFFYRSIGDMTSQACPTQPRRTIHRLNQCPATCTNVYPTPSLTHLPCTRQPQRDSQTEGSSQILPRPPHRRIPQIRVHPTRIMGAPEPSQSNSS